MTAGPARCDPSDPSAGRAGAGATDVVAGRFPVLAGTFEDPLSGTIGLLVDHVPAPLLDDPEASSRLRSWAAWAYPECSHMVVRLTRRELVLDGFDDHLVFLVLRAPQAEPAGAEPARGEPGPPGLVVAPARPADRPTVLGWLRRAFLDGTRAAGRACSDDGATRYGEAILDDPAATCLVARHHGDPVGHATVLVDQVDEVAPGARFTELVDVLVEPTCSVRREAEAALVGGCRRYAHDAGVPLVGNVVCTGDAARDEIVVGALESKGWQFSHKYQRHDLTCPGSAS